jgi:TolB-like protein/Tfp pilus assembly protein PilF
LIFLNFCHVLKIGSYFLFFRNWSVSSVLPTDKSIAILPLKNSGNAPEVEQLADGIVEDILNRLSKVSTLTVKSRNSSEIYRTSLKTTPEIAKELGVSYLAEGTILKEGENIRIYIQLIDAVNDMHLWSEQYDKDLSGIFTFISDVSRQIAGKLEAALSVKELEEIEKVYTEIPEAYQLYLKGRFFLNRRTKEEIKKSIDYFNQALEIDPNYSLAWAGLGDSYFNLVRYNFISEAEGKVKSREYAMKSLEIDNSLAESHAVLGTIALILDMNWKEAERELNLALELNPKLNLAHLYYGHYLRNRGKFEEAIKHYSIAIDLDPNVLIPYDSRAYCLYQMGKFSESLVEWEKVKEINKFYRSAYKISFLIYVRQGEDFKAIKELKTLISIFYPEVETDNILKEIYSKSGIEGVIRWYIKLRVENGEAYGIDRLYAVIDDWDNALLNLEKIQWHLDYGLIKYGIEYKPIQNDPRFIALLNKMGMDNL